MKTLTPLEKILLGVVGAILFSWMSWLSWQVVQLSGKQREDSAQWKAINSLRSFHFERHSHKPAP
jgi:hypothetical protein